MTTVFTAATASLLDKTEPKEISVKKIQSDLIFIYFLVISI